MMASDMICDRRACTCELQPQRRAKYLKRLRNNNDVCDHFRLERHLLLDLYGSMLCTDVTNYHRSRMALRSKSFAVY